MKTMRAWRFERFGGPEVLQRVDVPVPTPAPGEVLVKVLATGVNPSDVMTVAGAFHSPLPRTPGRDFAGIIAGGSPHAGEEVWGSGTGFGVARDGALAEYVSVPYAWLAPKPACLTPAQTAAIGVPYLAAWSALVETGQIQGGQAVLITGVSGAVGRAATQIAHWKGARVIGAALSTDNPAGADAIVDARTQDLAVEARKLTDGKGVDLALDVVGGEIFQQVALALRHGGRVVVISSKPPIASFNLADFYQQEKQLAGVGTMAFSGERVGTLLARIGEGFDTGALHAPSPREWAFDRGADAYAAAANRVQGKHVIVL